MRSIFFQVGMRKYKIYIYSTSYEKNELIERGKDVNKIELKCVAYGLWL